MSIPALDRMLSRFWSGSRGRLDLVFVDAGASGEVLAARSRVHIAYLLILIHLLPGWPSGTDLIVLALAILILGYSLVLRRHAASHYSTPMGYATSIADVTCVTVSLALMCFGGDLKTPLYSPVRFHLYFLALFTSSLKMNWRISAVAGALSVVQYGALVAAVGFFADPFPDWPLHVGRLGTLAGAAYLGTVVVLRAQQLCELSTTDFLTGLANRAVLDGRLAEELSRAHRHQRRLALALVDIDHFKGFNDRHGHAEGDVVLRGLAVLLRRSVRESDLVARYGGEEFAVLLPETGAREARAKLEALRVQVENARFEGGNQPLSHQLTLSAGIAEFPSDGASAAEMFAAADQRLYEAKRTGRNKVVAAAAAGARGDTYLMKAV